MSMNALIPQPVDVSIYNSVGKLMMNTHLQAKTGEHQYTFDLEALPVGTYLTKIIINDHTIQSKLVKY